MGAMEPVTVRIEPEQLGELVRSWSFTGVTLRPAGAAEARLAAELAVRAQSDLRAPTPEALEQHRARSTAAIENGDLLVFVEHDGVPIGVLRGELYPLSPGRRELYVSCLALLPERRCAGLGTRLLQHLERWLPSVGATAVTLDYMAYNRRVAAFYARLGFEIVGYDLLCKRDLDSTSPGRDGWRVYDASDEGSVVRFLRGRRGLATFEQPCWSEATIAARLREHAALGDQRVLLVERAGALVGVCWGLGKTATSGATIVVSLCFESDDERTSSLLLDGLEALAAEERAVESYVTLWQPCGIAHDLALARGYVIGRYKARKILGE